MLYCEVLGLGDGATDAGELALGVATQLGQSHDADHGDEGQEECVLDEGGAPLALDVQAGLQVVDHVHDVVPLWASAPFGGCGVALSIDPHRRKLEDVEQFGGQKEGGASRSSLLLAW